MKDKVGNRSNAGCEVEFQDAWGVLIGEEGRGIPTIIEMAGYTRLNCVIGSAALLRQGAVQALAYARRRMAFGKCLAEQPLMRAVLADLALESEAALLLAARLSEAFERDDEPAQRAWKRIITPAAKFWVCKRAVELSGEAMEVFGGNGYVDGPMARLYREAPLNSIWEGSGNVMCLDLIRALQREPEAWQALLADLTDLSGGEPALIAALAQLRQLAARPAELEPLGRRFAQLLALTAQACLLARHAPEAVAQGFIASRLDDGQWGGWPARWTGAGWISRPSCSAPCRIETGQARRQGWVGIVSCVPVPEPRGGSSWPATASGRRAALRRWAGDRECRCPPAR